MEELLHGATARTLEDGTRTVLRLKRVFVQRATRLVRRNLMPRHGACHDEHASSTNVRFYDPSASDIVNI